MKIIAIIQARMGSTRLPGKVLKDIDRKPMLQRVIERVCKSKLLNDVFVATTTASEDDPISELCGDMGIKLFRGSSYDVLDRYYQTACYSKADIIVRITADCPLIDPALIDRAVSAFCNGSFDYLSTAYPEPSFPDGLDVEVMSFGALKKAWRKATKPSDREHVCPYIYNTNPDEFKLGLIRNDHDFSNYRWTVDEESDLEFVKAVYSHLGKSFFSMADVLAFLERHPQLKEINSGISRNEGYQLSVEKDGNR